MANAGRAAPSVKRLMKEAKQMSDLYDKHGDIQAAPLGEGDNLFDWHFTIRGPSDSPFEDGIYHGRLIFPPQYPMKPPEIILLTPNGRFETHKKICLSISGYHPETWLPSWSISTALRALQAFFTTPAKGAIGGLEWPEAERRRIAKKSPDWYCDQCKCKMSEILAVRGSKKDSEEVYEKSEEAEQSGKTEEVKAEVKSDLNNNEVENEKAVKPDEKEEKNVPAEDKSEAKTRQSRETEIRAIENQIMRQQLEYQKNDTMSLIFMVVLFVLVAILLVRKVNKIEVDDAL